MNIDKTMITSIGGVFSQNGRRAYIQGLYPIIWTLYEYALDDCCFVWVGGVFLDFGLVVDISR